MINNNNNINRKANVISAGKTFYKWVKAFPEKRRSIQSRKSLGNKIISINNIEDKFINNNNNINSNPTNNNNITQNGFFDSKNFSSNIMSNTMMGTQEGFFKRNDSANGHRINEVISIREKFADSKTLNMLFNSQENDLMKEDINPNVLKINQENLRSKRLSSSHSKLEEKKEFKILNINNNTNNNNIIKNNNYNPIVIKSENFIKNALGINDNKNNTNLIFPLIKNHNDIQKEKNIRSKISMINKNKMRQQAENSGYNFFRKTYNLIPNKPLTIHDLK